MKRIALAMTAIAVSFAAPTFAQPKESPPCLRVGQIYDFKALPGNRSLVVTDNFRKKFKLTLIGTCRDLDFNLSLGFKSFGGTSLTCLSRGDSVISRDVVGPPDRCPIKTIEDYTPAMEKADLDAAAAAKAARAMDKAKTP